MADLKADPSVDRLVASMADSMVVRLAGPLAVPTVVYSDDSLVDPKADP